VEDFAADGVVYLELRTTPKDLPARGVTKESYCEAAWPYIITLVHFSAQPEPFCH